MRYRLVIFAAALSAVLQLPGSGHAICRIVEPLEETGGVVFDPTTMALYVIAQNQPVRRICVPVPLPPLGADDAGAEGAADDASADDDAGGASGDDDAGAWLADGVLEEMTDDRPCAAGEQLGYERGSIIHLAIQPSVLAWGGNAGLVMPVPARPDIHRASPRLFEELGARLTPRIEMTIEYIEDESLGQQCSDPKACNMTPAAATS